MRRPGGMGETTPEKRDRDPTPIFIFWILEKVPQNGVGVSVVLVIFSKIAKRTSSDNLLVSPYSEARHRGGTVDPKLQTCRGYRAAKAQGIRFLGLPCNLLYDPGNTSFALILDILGFPRRIESNPFYHVSTLAPAFPKHHTRLGLCEFLDFFRGGAAAPCQIPLPNISFS